MKILIVEDEKETLNFLVQLLKRQQFIVKSAENLHQAREELAGHEFDLIILDRAFPDDEDGLELCKELRERQKEVLIMILSARSGASARAAGLRIGADDYLEKPYHLSEFLARVNALLRRRQRKFFFKQIGPFEINEQKSQIFYNKKILPLKHKEFHLMNYFLHNPNRIITESEIFEQVWDDNKLFTKSNTINVHLAHIRKKLGEAKQYIKTVHGSGFICELPKDVSK